MRFYNFVIKATCTSFAVVTFIIFQKCKICPLCTRLRKLCFRLLRKALLLMLDIQVQIAYKTTKYSFTKSFGWGLLFN